MRRTEHALSFSAPCEEGPLRFGIIRCNAFAHRDRAVKKIALFVTLLPSVYGGIITSTECTPAVFSFSTYCVAGRNEPGAGQIAAYSSASISGGRFSLNASSGAYRSGVTSVDLRAIAITTAIDDVTFFGFTDPLQVTFQSYTPPGSVVNGLANWSVDGQSGLRSLFVLPGQTIHIEARVRSETRCLAGGGNVACDISLASLNFSFATPNT